MTTPCQPTCLGTIPLKVKKEKDCKFVCYPVIQGPPGQAGSDGVEGPPAPETRLINNTSFVDAQFGVVGVPEDPTQPYPDLQSAVSAIPAGEEFWQIFIWPGDYANPALVTSPAGMNLAIRGSGTGSTIIRAPFFNPGTAGETLYLANFSQIVEADASNMTINNSGNIQARDMNIERTETTASGSVFLNPTTATGTLSVRDSQITYTSTLGTFAFAFIQGGNFRLTSNQITINTVSSSLVVFQSPNDGERAVISDNIVDYTFTATSTPFLYVASVTTANVRLVVNDNHHTIRVGGATPPPNFQIYRQFSTTALILGRNNEYRLLGFQDEGGPTPVTSIVGFGGTGPVKVVDDTFPERAPLPPPTPNSSVDPGGEFQYQFNTGNALATNQGIQLATRRIVQGDPSPFLLTDDDFFVRLLTNSAVGVIQLPTPSARFRGKEIIIRNERGSTVSVQVGGPPVIPALAIPAGETRQYINDGMGGAWRLIGGTP